LREVAVGTTVEDVLKATEAELIVPEQVGTYGM
jgi:acyl CoA:acetate/3-ketoacid CoA transferase beta subunit